jgi:hypothetical protein
MRSFCSEGYATHINQSQINPDCDIEAQPAQALWAAVIRQAIIDLTAPVVKARPGDSSDRRAKAASIETWRESAHKWFFGSGLTGAGSFAWCCKACGLDAGYVRASVRSETERITAKRNNHKTRRKAMR